MKSRKPRSRSRPPVSTPMSPQQKAVHEISQRCDHLYANAQFVELEALGRQWVERYPQKASGAWKAIALAQMQTGRMQEAESSLRNGLENDADNVDLLDTLGVVLNKLGRYSGAHEIFTRVLELEPRRTLSLRNAAANLNEWGRSEEALERADAMLLTSPTDRHGLLIRGNALIKLNRPDEAIETYQRLCRSAPEWPDAWNNFGSALMARHYDDGAIAAFRQVVDLNPRQAEAWHNLGILLLRKRETQLALDCMNKAIDLRPDFVDSYQGVGSLLYGEGLQRSALQYFEHARSLRPTFPLLYPGLGACLQDLGMFDEAVMAYCTALELKPDYPDAFSALLFVLNYHPTLEASQIFKMYQEFEATNILAAPGDWAPHDNDRTPGRKLRIGYVSPDFCEHPMRYFLEPVVAGHDHTDLELFAYSDVAFHDGLTHRYKSYFDSWRDVNGLTNREFAELIRSDKIDILVDLAGHTAKNRLQALSLKPAPIQVTWMGYGSTTGLSAIDYMMADRAMLPEGCETVMSEKPWRLPHSSCVYRPASNFPEPNPSPALANGYVTFGCLSRSVRINDGVLDVWAEILKRVPNSRLCINSRDFRTEEMREWMVARFAQRGIEASRLDVGFNSPAWIPMQGVDIMLDCFPHNSGTTLLEGLYVGLPVVSFAHRPTVGRIGSSVLTAIGRPEWIAHDADGYIQIAADLAADVEQLAELRAALPGQIRQSDLMNEAQLCRDVEQAYREMWQKYCEEVPA